MTPDYPQAARLVRASKDWQVLRRKLVEYAGSATDHAVRAGRYDMLAEIDFLADKAPEARVTRKPREAKA